MKVTVDSRAPLEVATDLLALPMSTLGGKKARLAPRVAEVDRALGGQIAAVVANGDFSGKKGEALVLYPAGRRMKARRVVLLGLGDAAQIDVDALRCIAGRAIGHASGRKVARVALVLPKSPLAGEAPGIQALAEGAVLAGYRYDVYRGGKDDDGDSRVTTFSLHLERGGNLRSARAAAKRGVVLAESQNEARQLSNEPANALPPAELASAARRVAKEVGLRVRVLDVPELERRKMGAILAVGSGSAHTPRLIVLEHVPGGRKRAGSRPFCMVGKGITFDSGGISIKPSPGMDEMKHDMSGAAAVVGAMRACALLDLPTHVVGIIGAAENMPSSTAYRPGDIVTSMSGKTIEILNTDAEGRVVLADALHYAKTEYDPCAIVDLATLTGACVVALGRFATGLFGNHEGLSEMVRAAGEATAERAWPMPLLKDHKEEMRSEIADVKNAGVRHAGASTAAGFLWHFVDDTPWVHLDIAGTGWTSKTGPYQAARLGRQASRLIPAGTAPRATTPNAGEAPL
jgi:leucyl aminopeptidase